MIPTARPLRLVGALALLLGAACSGGARRVGAGGAPGPSAGTLPDSRGGAETGGAARPVGGGPSDGARDAAPGDPGTVSLTDRDLAPIDGYIKKRSWVLGDVVEVVASKEYFAQYISISARIGLAKRVDSEDANGMTSVITYLGTPEQLDVSTAPRLLIGTGITVSARQKLVLRFARTRNPDVPVRLRITAQGKARQGVGDQTLRREESIVLGAGLRRLPGGGYQYEEQ